MILGLTDFRDKNKKEKRNLGQVKVHIWFSQEKPYSGEKMKRAKTTRKGVGNVSPFPVSGF